MDKINETKKVSTVGGDNVIKFPKPPPPSRGSSEEDVDSGTRLQINFEPDWDTDKDNPPDSTA